MKTVIYIRHAKSYWGDPGARDFDRVLNERGRRDAPKMAEILKARVKHLDGIISSPSMRTRLTLQPFQEIYNLENKQVIFDEKLYHADTSYLIEALYGTDSSWETVALFSHNPGISMVNHKIDRSFYENVPTSGVTRIDFDVKEWTEVHPSNGKINFFIYPKMFSNNA